MEMYIRIWSSHVSPRFYMGSTDYDDHQLTTYPNQGKDVRLSSKDSGNIYEYVAAKLSLDKYKINKIDLTISLSRSIARRINLTWDERIDDVLTNEVMENMRQNFIQLSKEQQQNLDSIKVPGIGLSHYFNIFYLELVGVMAMLTILSYSQDTLGNPLEPLNPAFPSVDIVPELITQQTGTYLYALCQGLTKIPLQTLGSHLASLTQGFFSTFGSALLETNDYCSMLEVSSANLEAMTAISSYYSSDVKYMSSQMETVRKDLNLLEHSLEEYKEKIQQIDMLAHQRQKIYFNAGFSKIVGMSVHASQVLHQALKAVKADMEEHQKRIYQYVNRVSLEQVDQILATGRQQSLMLGGQLQHYQEEMIKLGQTGEQTLINQKEHIKQLVREAGHEAKEEAEEIRSEISSEYQIVHQKAREEVIKLQNKWKELLFQMEQEVRLVETGCKDELKQEQIALQQTLVEQQRICISSIQEHTKLLLEQQEQVTTRINGIIEQTESHYQSMEKKIEQFVTDSLTKHADTIRQEIEKTLSDRLVQIEQNIEQEMATRLSQEALNGRNETLIKTQVEKMIKQQWESIFNNKLAEVDRRLKSANLIYQQSLLVNEQSGLLNKNIPKTTVVKANVINDSTQSQGQEHIPNDLLDHSFPNSIELDDRPEQSDTIPNQIKTDNPYKPGITILSGNPSQMGKMIASPDPQKFQPPLSQIKSITLPEPQMVRYTPGIYGKLGDQNPDIKFKRPIIPAIQTVE